MWTHQIKTPIAAMHLLLQEEETPVSKELQGELFQVEQYVQMALQYLRMERMNTDLVFEKQELDALIHQAVRKYAPLFIRRSHCNMRMSIVRYLPMKNGWNLSLNRFSRTP